MARGRAAMPHAYQNFMALCGAIQPELESKQQSVCSSMLKLHHLLRSYKLNRFLHTPACWATCMAAMR